VNRRPYTVIGIAAPEFRGMTPALAMDVYMPMALVNQLKPMEVDRLDRRGSRSLLMKGRLREGVTHERAAAAVAAVGNRLAAAYPESNEGRFMSALPTTDVALHPIVDKVLMPVAALMLAVVGMVLLIACVNLASFLLARAADRRREIAIRLSIGAKRIQLVRQLLIESVTLSLLGGVAGIFLAIWLVGVLTRFQPPIPVPIKLDIAVDGVVLAFTFGVAAIAGVLFGLVPALHATRPDVAHSRAA
jgi:predicted lysophospholipase L1 biosynthesis ABC-type transport system permease subunit